MTSRYREDTIIRQLLPDCRNWVDIGCGNGWCWSNTEELAKYLVPGLAIDCNPALMREAAAHYEAMPHVDFMRIEVTPEIVGGLIEMWAIGRGIEQLDFVSLDIDGYDLPVGRSIMASTQPALFCCEFCFFKHPKVPWHMEFTPGYRWNQSDRVGASVAAWLEVARKEGYGMVAATGGNLFFRYGAEDRLSAAEAYEQSIDDLLAGGEKWVEAAKKEAYGV